MSKAIGMIKDDKSLKAQTAKLREQIRIEYEEYGGNRGPNAEEWRKLILSGRVGYDKNIEEERKRYRKLAELLPDNIKLRLPSITPSGWVFPRYHNGGPYKKLDRRIVDAAMILNGLVCVDIDGLGDKLPTAKQRLVESGLCSLVATSARGNGLYAMVRYDKNRYWGVEGFRAAREAIWDAIRWMELKPDEQCKNTSRRRFLAHDPDMWVDDSDTARLREK